MRHNSTNPTRRSPRAGPEGHVDEGTTPPGDPSDSSRHPSGDFFADSAERVDVFSVLSSPGASAREVVRALRAASSAADAPTVLLSPDGLTPFEYALAIGREDLADVILSYEATLTEDARRAESEAYSANALGGSDHPFFRALASHILRRGGAVSGELDMALALVARRLAAGRSVDRLSFNDAVNGAKKELSRIEVSVKAELRLPSRRWTDDVGYVVSRLLVPARFYGIELPFDPRHAVDYVLSDARGKKVAVKILCRTAPEDGREAVASSARSYAASVERWDRNAGTGKKRRTGRADDVEEVMQLPGGHSLVRLTTEEAMIYEGSMLGHCVGKGGYAHYVGAEAALASAGKRRTGIYSVRRGEVPRATLEIDGYVKQVKGPGNALVPPDAAEDTFHAIQELGFNVSSHDLMANGYVRPSAWQTRLLTFKSIAFGSETYAHLQSMRLSKKIKTEDLGADDVLPVLAHLAGEPGADARIKLVKELLARDGIANREMALASTALAAFAVGNVEIAKTALRTMRAGEGEVTINAGEGLYGYSALHWGVELDDDEVLELAAARGAALDNVARYGSAPLLLAAQKGRLAAMRRLLALGADPRAASDTGATALHEALRYARGDEEALPLVETLLGAGADPGAATEFGHTPTSIARKADLARCLEALGRAAGGAKGGGHALKGN